MSSEWPLVRLEEITSVLGDGLHGTPNYDDNGDYHFINGNNLFEGRVVINEKTKRVSEAEAHKHRKPLNQNTILVSINGTLGNIAIYQGEKVVFGTRACYFSGSTGVDKHFVRYVLQSDTFQNHIHNLATGSTIKNVSLRLMRDFSFQLPPLREQNRISAVLKSLDDRINLLRETNATLEAIAQALFKSWFVDFDPVHAKARGEPPQGMDDATAALFPASFEESELGRIPKGWKVTSLDNIAHFLNGLALQKFPPEDEQSLPVIKIAQLRKGDTTGADRASRFIKPEYIIQNGDVLFSWSGSLEVETWCGGEGALNQHLFKVTSDMYPKWFYYRWTKQHLSSFQQIAASKATTMGHIQRKHLTEALVVIPSEDVLSEADMTFNPLLNQWINNALQAQTLAQLRDTLLPKLISGQLRLPEAQVLLAEELP
ncbi:MAG: restriction endonuclease subunit S [Aeromonadaceae bacterium]